MYDLRGYVLRNRKFTDNLFYLTIILLICTFVIYFFKFVVFKYSTDHFFQLNDSINNLIYYLNIVHIFFQRITIIIFFVLFTIHSLSIFGYRNASLSVKLKTYFYSKALTNKVISYFNKDELENNKLINEVINSINIDVRESIVHVTVNFPMNYQVKKEFDMILPEIRNYIAKENNEFTFNKFEQIENDYYYLEGRK